MPESFDPRERLTRAEWDAMIATRVGETVARAAQTPAGRRALLAGGQPLTSMRWPEDLARLPLLRKDELPRLQAESPPLAGWNARPTEELTRIFVSPGPIYDPEGPAEDYWGFAPGLHAAGFRRGEVVLNTFAYHLTPAGHMFDGACRALGCVVIPSGVGNTEAQVRAAADLRVAAFIGTPSFLATVLERAAGSLALRVAFVSGEMLTDRLRADLERAGVAVSQGYATADVGAIAYECERRDGLHLSPRVHVEIIDPQTAAPCAPGEPGEVVVTFLSETYPLLRLATGDLSVLDPTPCTCGRPSPRLVRVLGRVGEAVKVRGMFVHPNEVRFAMAAFPEIGRYQLVVTRAGHQDVLTAHIELAPERRDAARALAEEVSRRLHEVVRLRVVVEVTPSGTVPEDAPVLVDARRWE